MKKIKSYNLSKVVIDKIHSEALLEGRKDSDYLDRYLLNQIVKDIVLLPTPVTTPKPKTKRFKPPTICEVSAYCEERQNNVNPESFINHYESNGWMRGKAKVKDWKACVRTWEQNSSNKKTELDFSDDKTGWSNQDYGLIR